MDFSFHFFTHLKHTKSISLTVKEIAVPLLTGSFTTIMAFWALLFTNSPILQDFGLFAALSITGAVLFTLIGLPIFLKLFHFKGLDFLNDLEWSLSEWDQIQLLEVLHRLENQQLPNITPWLRSKNDSVVIFALKLLKYYSQYEGKTEFLELLNHKNDNIRLKTIELLKEFDFKDAKDDLKNNFNDKSTEDQIAFLRSLESNHNAEDEPFLLNQAKNENFKIKFSALKILKNINIKNLAKLKESSTDPEYVKMVNFIENN